MGTPYTTYILVDTNLDIDSIVILSLPTTSIKNTQKTLRKISENKWLDWIRQGIDIWITHESCHCPLTVGTVRNKVVELVNSDLDHSEYIVDVRSDEPTKSWALKMYLSKILPPADNGLTFKEFGYEPLHKLLRILVSYSVACASDDNQRRPSQAAAKGVPQVPTRRDSANASAKRGTRFR